MLSNSQKEHLTYTAVWQVVILAALVVVIFQYIIPGIKEISAQADKTQLAIDSYAITIKDGISDTNLQGLLQWKAEYGELVKVIQSDISSAKEAIKKDNMSIKEGWPNDYSCTGVDYMTCLKNVLWRSDKEKASIVTEKSKLNSIIPTMSPFSNNIEEKNNITLKQYVNYIEKTIMRQFNFDSNVIIGMQGLTFGKKWGIVPESIGMFDFRLDFTASNADIAKFIEYINESGEPAILSRTGILSSDQIPGAMSNPLITLESFSIQEQLDSDNPTKENSGRATLRFYVRGVSKEDLSYLKENIKAKQADLEALITESVKVCEKNGPVCTYKKRLLSFQTKYQEYIRSLNAARISVSGSDEIYALTQSANTLKSLEEELSSIIPNK